jgi:hypothetical protein
MPIIQTSPHLKLHALKPASGHELLAGIKKAGDEASSTPRKSSAINLHASSIMQHQIFKETPAV